MASPNTPLDKAQHLHRLGKLDAAARAYRKALQKQRDAGTLYQFATLEFQRGKHRYVADLLQEALQRAPQRTEIHAEIYNLFGLVSKYRGHSERALQSFQRAIELKPDYAEAFSNLGNALDDQGRSDEAILAYRRAVTANPSLAAAHFNLGRAYVNLGLTGEATDAFRRAVALEPDYAKARAALLLHLNCSASQDRSRLFRAHSEWAARWMSGIHAAPRPSLDRDARRPPRIGYLSPDFRRHSVAAFSEALLAHHRLPVTCYASLAQPDDTTERLQRWVPRWRDVARLSDRECAALIAKDRIDILVDLAGYTDGSRLGVLRYRPAPIQVSYLGYPATTGLSVVDYRLTDALSDPPGCEPFYSEALLRLEPGFLCYTPFAEAPQPATSPRDFIAFGSFNNPIKITDSVVETWARILNAVANSRLLLKGQAFAHAHARQYWQNAFAAHGIASERLQLLPRIDAVGEHLGAYAEIDIALDPFPYNGVTTTCEALWMGVPVLSLRGQTHAGRVGSSLLSQLGMDDWVAASVDDYVGKAVAMASDRKGLAALRKQLRPRMAASPLCDGAGFTARLETVYRSVWQRWCKNSTENHEQNR